MSDFWDELTLGMHKEASSLDRHLGSRVPAESIRNLTDKLRAANALPLPIAAGTRVSFVDNLGAVLSYPDPPVGGSEGTVVTVRCASGDMTHLDSLVFVKWDSGAFLPVHHEHLRRASDVRVASTYSLRVAAIGDLTDFMKTAGEDLVHKATKDLWAMKRVGDEYVIERLFDETGAPLKV
jgi:hypothetical protein